jgi:hypothetical protein
VAGQKINGGLMSHQMTVVIEKELIPSIIQINDELKKKNIPCQIVSGESLDSPNGILLGILENLKIEKQIQFERSSILNENPGLKKNSKKRNYCFDFTLGTDMAECAIISAICAVLVSLAKAIIYYEPDDLYYDSFESNIEEFNNAIIFINKERK